MGIKRWKLPSFDENQIEDLSRECGLPWILCAVLASRGVTSAKAAQEFLSDNAEIEDPFVMADMDKAAARVSEAIECGERIAVYGDYDCDGVSATALLTSYLQSVGADVIYYVPSRDREGYGLNKPAIKMLSEQKTDVIVTVDNGISAHEEVDYANSLGMDVVITDHHTPRQTLPNAIAVINPHRRDCKSKFKDLAGVGVVFKLICAIENASPAELLEYYSDMVALGTIADVVPLLGENRTIVKHGLSRLAESDKPGIAALLEVSGLKDRELTCESAAFGIIPRINAAGRMGAVDDIIELFLTDSLPYAEEIAADVNLKNDERKKAEEQIMLDIDGILRDKKEILTKRVMVISGNNWHHGVVGIAASKVMEKYGKPCILLSVDGDTARGSGRSLDGFSLIEAITVCSEHLTQFGGHKLAVGVTLPTGSIEAFSADLEKYARENYDAMPVAAYNISCILPHEQLTVENISRLMELEPFGAANEAPLFLLKGLVIGGIYPTADKKHIRIRFSYDDMQFYAVYFRMSESLFPYCAGDIVDIVAGVSAGEFNGKPQLSVKIRDLRPSGAPQDSILDSEESYLRHLRSEDVNDSDFKRLLPTRDDLGVIYRYLRKCGGYPYGTSSLYYKIMGAGMDYCTMLVALDVMEELNLITRVDDGEGISLVPDPPRVNIENSAILSNLKSEMRVNGNG